MEGMGREVEGQHPATRRKVELSGCQFLVSFKSLTHLGKGVQMFVLAI